MAHCRGKLSLPLACKYISTITIIIQIQIASCTNDERDTSVGTVMSPPTSMKNKTPNKKHELFDANLEGVDLTIIPGWRDDDDFDNWDPPRGIQRDVPTYIAGFDNSSRPIWVMEFGKFNFGKYVKGGKAKQDLLLKYLRYLAYIGIKSHALRSTVKHPVDRHVKIYDYEGFRPEMVTDRRVHGFLKKISASYQPYFVKYVGRVIHINLNSVSEIFVNIQSNARGFIKQHQFGRGGEEFYGTNKYEWGPQVAKSFPVNQLPEWYGGRKGFKPVYVIG